MNKRFDASATPTPHAGQIAAAAFSTAPRDEVQRPRKSDSRHIGAHLGVSDPRAQRVAATGSTIALRGGELLPGPQWHVKHIDMSVRRNNVPLNPGNRQRNLVVC